MKKKVAALTERQQEVLRELETFHKLMGRDEWARPMDVGGGDASHHSVTLKQLVKRRLAAMRERGTLRNWLHPKRKFSSKEYRLTEAGRWALKKMKVSR